MKWKELKQAEDSGQRYRHVIKLQVKWGQQFDIAAIKKQDKTLTLCGSISISK